MENLPIKILYSKIGALISKIDELPGRDIGEPDCLLLDPCYWDFGGGHDHDEEGNHIEREFQVMRFPGKSATLDTKIAIHSSNIYAIMEPTQSLVSEYLIAISD